MIFVREFRIVLVKNYSIGKWIMLYPFFNLNSFIMIFLLGSSRSMASSGICINLVRNFLCKIKKKNS